MLVGRLVGKAVGLAVGLFVGLFEGSAVGVGSKRIETYGLAEHFGPFSGFASASTESSIGSYEQMFNIIFSVTVPVAPMGSGFIGSIERNDFVSVPVMSREHLTTSKVESPSLVIE